MILQSLYELAKSENLLEDPDYEMKRVAWLIRLNSKGCLVGPIQSRQETRNIPQSSKKKPKLVAKPMKIPRQMPSRSGKCPPAEFLVDNALYVFGVATKDKKKSVKSRKRAALFLKRVEECANATKDEGVKAVEQFLQQVESGNQVVKIPETCKSNDLFAFTLESDIDVLVHERKKVVDYWRKQRSFIVERERQEFYCFVTGKPCHPVEKHKKVKVPGEKGRIALISFNKNAFESHGWCTNENAPISREASEACMVALDRLLDQAPPDPHDPNLTLPKRNILLSSDTIVCYWTRDVRDEFQDGFGYSLAVDEEGIKSRPEQVAEMYNSIWKGKRYLVTKPDAFYSLTLSGGQGRATLRDWIETNTQTVTDNLADYFGDLDMVRYCPPPKGKLHPSSFPIQVLLEAIADPCERRREGIPPHLAAALFKSAVSGNTFPLGVFERAVLRYRFEIRNEKEQNGGWQTMQWNDARVALIKAVLARTQRLRKNAQLNKEVKTTMNPKCNEQGYVLGQLMAVIERMQLVALGKVDATVVDRYFGGASIAPKTVFVGLLRNARHHASKAREDRGNAGLVFRLEKLIDHIADCFKPHCGNGPHGIPIPNDWGFPASLDLNQQGFFILGYHQMRKWLWMSKAERSLWEQENKDVPSVYLWQ